MKTHPDPKKTKKEPPCQFCDALGKMTPATLAKLHALLDSLSDFEAADVAQTMDLMTGEELPADQQMSDAAMDKTMDAMGVLFDCNREFAVGLRDEAPHLYKPLPAPRG